MRYCLAITKSKVSTYATTWMNLRNMMQPERSQIKDYPLCDSVDVKCPEKANLYRDRKQISACLGWGLGVRLDGHRHGRTFWSNKNDLKLDCGDGCII